jgi:2,4-dienoyl-CoA reductase-like NADH-dependent reductase (Old Yellow Enzyme family)
VLNISILFEPIKIGKMEVRNRFVRSATIENLANENGEVTDSFLKFYRTLAKGEIGLIIPGYMYVHPLGQAYKYQTGIYMDDLIPGLKKIVNIIHEENGKIAFQIVHAGSQTFSKLIGTTPMGPSGDIINPVSMDYSKEMTEIDIQESIEAFVQAAKRAVGTGVDAIQLHAAHGYLINQFLSPFYNRRKDDWGGSDEGRFRYLKEIITKTKKILPKNIPLLIKLNTNDYTPEEGITPSLAVKYSEWLVNLGIDAIEVSCGSATYAIFNMCRGEVPVNEIVQAVPSYMKEMTKQIYQDMVGKFDFKEAYNLNAAKMIKPVMGDIPLILVGGLKNKALMEKIIRKKYADLISMARPFIREPLLIKHFKEEKQDKAACTSCNRCLAAIPNNFPISCYVNNFPEKKKPTNYFP